MLDAYIYDGLRTPFGRLSGSLSRVRPDDLLAGVLRALVDRNPFAAGDIEDVLVGCANQAGEDSRCVARHAALVAGLPIEVPGAALQRNCGSGMNAVIAAAHAITAGEGGLMLAGGVESMSRAPFVVAKAEQAFARDFKVFDSTVGARFPNPKVEAEYGADTMPQTADNLAAEHGITREEADAFALRSQQRWAAAQEAGFFAGEIAPVSIPAARKGPPTEFSVDEHPRPDTTAEALAKLRALNAGGVTTAGNASGVNDGAVAMLVGSRQAGEKAGAAPAVRILASAVAGVAPRIMGYGPVPASQKALERAGLSVKDMDVVEINEAFAAQVLACAKGLGIAGDDTRLNPNGGAIALGHPLGASGPRIVLTAARQLERTGGRYALATMCIGVGQGIAVVLERVR
ncbi:3-oxoadipyl-CoA thiolase [Azospirillum sp. RWY-5-1]|uniref:acetyl-CoA C-acyltransferase n=1 Tax=Azospirillum oleiclasticum TaxID=2735135 RepID=A0ABX2TCG6_9PROT|nr:3-oxoadipyl-CoA thiolase [Azospirillum oleiclasticum]NYZ13914.1 3-oxoadipyl-CoA thiolase [Azospirillum oleiclasticum]NYZ20838.1 3-oxoadipyl-CoA thiolase [Azospirillum oleiclasticum]